MYLKMTLPAKLSQPKSQPLYSALNKQKQINVKILINNHLKPLKKSKPPYNKSDSFISITPMWEKLSKLGDLKAMAASQTIDSNKWYAAISIPQSPKKTVKNFLQIIPGIKKI